MPRRPRTLSGCRKNLAWPDQGLDQYRRQGHLPAVCHLHAHPAGQPHYHTRWLNVARSGGCGHHRLQPAHRLTVGSRQFGNLPLPSPTQCPSGEGLLLNPGQCRKLGRAQSAPPILIQQILPPGHRGLHQPMFIPLEHNFRRIGWICHSRKL